MNKKELKASIFSYYQDYKNIDPSDMGNIEYNLDNDIEKELDYCRIEYDLIKHNNIKDKRRIKRLNEIWDELNYLKSENESGEIENDK